MRKVIKIVGTSVYVSNGDSFDIFDESDFGFAPQIGDTVKIYQNGNDIVIEKDNDVVGSVKNAGTTIINNIQNEYVNQKKVNKVVYILLAILLGDLGVHEFYAGNVFAGIISVLFCWTGIPALVGLIKGIIAIGKKEDGDGNIYI